MIKYFWVLTTTLLIISCGQPGKKKNTPAKLRAVIIDGQNNHYVWPKTSMMMKDYLEQTGLFEVDIYRMDSVWLGVKYNKSRPEPYTYFIETYPLDSTAYTISYEPIKTSQFSFDFSEYDLVVSNLGDHAPLWPEETQRNFEKYMRDGGGLVIVHAADNPWGNWAEFNKMIGLGGWGDRDSTTGPYVYYTEAGEIEKDYSKGICGSHGSEREFLITTRAPGHPIMKGLPAAWLHAKDELYDHMRGPFMNATILATAYSDVEENAPPWNPAVKGMGFHVPVLMAINYGTGRIFHTTLGHFDYSMECVGFITTLQRGSEWAATGNVTQPIPEDFPTANQTVFRKWNK